ncbi:hypothetical protein GWK47_022348 [Chionoecetes opilio]|uniref:Uncharacterized protein n=1 Tax=Chionoecetes opilio TaxID=41210 RepID=A0A8J4XQP5_CHIOP|nr:hypothetical protein GWK47_022348 [Chionoecetes opilio]
MLYQACLASLLVAAAVASFVDLHDPNHDIPSHLLLVRPRTRASACQDDLRKIRYLLWTRSNADDYAYYQLLPFHLDSLRASPLVPSLPTYVLYHGFNDMGLVEWITRSKTGEATIIYLLLFILCKKWGGGGLDARMPPHPTPPPTPPPSVRNSV